MATDITLKPNLRLSWAASEWGCKIRLNRHKVHTGVRVTIITCWHEEPSDSPMHCVADNYRAILRKYNLILNRPVWLWLESADLPWNSLLKISWIWYSFFLIIFHKPYPYQQNPNQPADSLVSSSMKTWLMTSARLEQSTENLKLDLGKDNMGWSIESSIHNHLYGGACTLFCFWCKVRDRFGL